MYTIEILGVDRITLLKAGTLNIQRRSDHRNSCSFTLITTAGGYLPKVGQDIKIMDTAVTIFGGIISTIKKRKIESGIGNNKLIEVNISSDGYQNIPQRRTPGDLNYYDQTCGYIVADMITLMLGEEGITSGVIDAGVTLAEYSTSVRSCKDILDEMASASGYKWYITDQKALYFIAEDTATPAAYDIVEGEVYPPANTQGYIYPSGIYDYINTGYDNCIILRNSQGDYTLICMNDTAVTRVRLKYSQSWGLGIYGVMSISNTYNCRWTTAGNAVDPNQEVEYIGMTYLVTSVYQRLYNNTLDSLIYSSFDLYDEDGVKVFAAMPKGTEFADFADVEVEESIDNYRNKQFVIGGLGDDGYQVSQYVEDATEIAARQTDEGGSGYSTGVYGNIIADGNIDVAADATAAANNALKQYGIIPQVIRFKSYTLDWIAGTKLKANLPTFGISSDSYYLIEEVSMQDEDGKNLSCTVSATARKNADFSTQRSQTGIDYFSSLVKAAKESNIVVSAGGGSGAGNVAIGITNTEEVTISTVESSVLSLSTLSNVTGKLMANFSATIIATGNVLVTAKAYFKTIAQPFIAQQTCAAGKWLFSFETMSAAVYPSGTAYPIEIKMYTDTGTATIEIGQAELIINTAPGVGAITNYAPKIGKSLTVPAPTVSESATAVTAEAKSISESLTVPEPVIAETANLT